MLEGVALFNGAIISNYCSSRKTNSAVQQMLTLKGLHMITRIAEVVSGNPARNWAILEVISPPPG